jgi:hypothetical protein
MPSLRTIKLVIAAALCAFAAICIVIFLFIARTMNTWTLAEGVALMIGAALWFWFEYRKAPNGDAGNAPRP